jgi:hypothetical protein
MAWFQTTKINYQMSPSSRIVGFRMWNHKYDTSNLSQFIPYNARGGITTFDNTEKVEWQKTYGSNLVTSLQYGFWQYHSNYWTFAPPGTPTTIDQITRQQTGAVGTPGQRPYNPRHHVKAAATWYKPNFFGESRARRPDYAYSALDGYPDLDPNTQEPDGAYSSAATYNYQLILRSGVPFQMAVYNSPANAWVVSKYTDLYFQDSWSIGSRLSLNAGVRYAHDNGSIPASCTETALAPANQTYPAACYPQQLQHLEPRSCRGCMRRTTSPATARR